jgi:hypothetical protein
MGEQIVSYGLSEKYCVIKVTEVKRLIMFTSNVRDTTHGISGYYECIEMNIDFGFRFRKRDIEHLINLTDSFTWEELPTRDPNTGSLTQTGYIPITQTIATYAPSLVYVIHMAQSAVRIVTSRDMVFPAWLPFDASVSPIYETANLVQVLTY